MGLFKKSKSTKVCGKVWKAKVKLYVVKNNTSMMLFPSKSTQKQFCVQRRVWLQPKKTAAKNQRQIQRHLRMI